MKKEKAIIIAGIAIMLISFFAYGVDSRPKLLSHDWVGFPEHVQLFGDIEYTDFAHGTNSVDNFKIDSVLFTVISDSGDTLT